MEIMKYCSKCDTTKPIEQFCKNKRSADGHAYQCKACIKVYQMSIKDKMREYQLQYQPKYKAEHKEYFREYLSNYQKTVYKEKHLAYIKEWKKRNPEKVEQYRKAMAERKNQANEQ